MTLLKILYIGLEKKYINSFHAAKKSKIFNQTAIQIYFNPI